MQHKAFAREAYNIITCHVDRIRILIRLEFCRAHTPRTHCTIYGVAFMCMAITFCELQKIGGNAA